VFTAARSAEVPQGQCHLAGLRDPSRNRLRYAAARASQHDHEVVRRLAGPDPGTHQIVGVQTDSFRYRNFTRLAGRHHLLNISTVIWNIDRHRPAAFALS